MINPFKKIIASRERQRKERAIERYQEIRREIAGLEAALAPNEHGGVRRDCIESNRLTGPFRPDYLDCFYFYDRDIDEKYTRLMKLTEQPVEVAFTPCGCLYTTHISQCSDMRHHRHYGGLDKTCPLGILSKMVTAREAIMVARSRDSTARPGGLYAKMPAEDYAEAIAHSKQLGRTPQVRDSHALHRLYIFLVNGRD